MVSRQQLDVLCIDMLCHGLNNCIEFGAAIPSMAAISKALQFST